MNRSIVHFDADAFAVAVERRRDGALCGRPVVIGSEARGRGLVICASYEARAHGVRAGLAVASARRRAPAASARSWVFLPPDPVEYRRVSALLGEFLADMAPVAEAAGLDDVILDVTGCEALFGGDLLGWARLAAGRAREELGMPLSAGVASNKFMARLAAMLAKPGGALRVLAGAEEAFLAPVPIALLPGVSPRVAGRLDGYGIVSAGEILRFPGETLGMLLGNAEAADLRRRARGEDHEAVVPMRRGGPGSGGGAGPPVIVSHSFDEDTRDPGVLRAAATLLAGRFAWSLRRRALLCAAAELVVMHIDGAPRCRALVLHQPTDAEETLTEAARTALFAALRRRVRVRRLDLLSLACVSAADERQLDLLEEARRLKLRREQGDLGRAVELVRERHGFEGLIPASALPALHVDPRAHD